MITDDLTTLWTGSDAPMSLRQGTIDAWDPDTGANTISVAGGTLVNIPVLIGETVILNAGDVVALLTTGDRWFLLGKVTDPGDPGTVPTWPGDIIDLTDVVIPAIEANIDAVEASVSALDAELAVTQGQVDTLNNTTLPALTADLATAQADITAAQTDLDTAEAALVTAQSDIDAVEASVATLNNTTLPGLASDLDAAQGDIDTLNNTTLPALQTQVDGILPITETDISDDAITTPKIAANAITAAEIATDAVTAGKILAGSVTTAKLDVGAVTAAKIAAGTITANELAAGAVTAVKIAADTITANEIAANAVTASELNAGAVTAGKIAADAVTANEIAAGAVTASELSAGAVTTVKLAAGAVTANEIGANAITATKIAAGAIDGKTITGALIRTVASGQRWEINSPALANEIRGYTGAVGEVTPATIQVTSSEMTLNSPDRGAGISTIEMQADATTNHVYVTADDGIFLRGDGAAHANQIWVSAADGAVMSAAGNTNQIWADAAGTSMDTTSGPDPISLNSGAGGIALASTGSVTLNGTRIAILPQCLSAACTALVDLTTAEVDITGATVTFTTVRPNAKFICTGSFYFSANQAYNNLALGKLSVDGTNQSAYANFTSNAAGAPTTAPDRVNSAQTWVGTLASAGSHTLKLRGLQAVAGSPAASSVRVNPTHTTITVLVFE